MCKLNLVAHQRCVSFILPGELGVKFPDEIMSRMNILPGVLVMLYDTEASSTARYRENSVKCRRNLFGSWMIKAEGSINTTVQMLIIRPLFIITF